MNGIFEKIGVNITKENKKNIEKIIHNIVGIEYKNYSETGKKIKKRIIEN
ncbi:hypothetical protein KJN74_05135 [Candidatus Bathyarchaeota archaeon]|nr:hypothetical protein [Candidatus Bathyarchaeota archaeon]